MLNLVIIMILSAMAFGTPDISELFDSFLKDTIDNQQLADGSLKTTYFNIPHRSAPGLIEPFIFSTHPTAAQITVFNIRRLRSVSKEVRIQDVSDGEDYDYSVMATALSMDIKITNLVGELSYLVGGSNKGHYLLNGNLRDLVMNVTMQTDGEYRVIPTRHIVPTTLDITVSGDDDERAIVESLASQIVGDLVTNLFHERFLANGDSSKLLEKAVRAYLVGEADYI